MYTDTITAITTTCTNGAHQGTSLTSILASASKSGTEMIKLMIRMIQLTRMTLMTPLMTGTKTTRLILGTKMIPRTTQTRMIPQMTRTRMIPQMTQMTEMIQTLIRKKTITATATREVATTGTTIVMDTSVDGVEGEIGLTVAMEGSEEATAVAMEGGEEVTAVAMEGSEEVIVAPLEVNEEVIAALEGNEEVTVTVMDVKEISGHTTIVQGTEVGIGVTAAVEVKAEATAAVEVKAEATAAVEVKAEATAAVEVKVEVKVEVIAALIDVKEGTTPITTDVGDPSQAVASNPQQLANYHVCIFQSISICCMLHYFAWISYELETME